MYRSYLMIPANKQKFLDKLLYLSCDVAMINLEDGISNKQEARELLYQNFANTKLSSKAIFNVIRINDINTEDGILDIKLVNKIKPDAVRIAKIRSIDDIKKALQLINKDIQIHLSIETKQIFSSISALRIDPRITTLYLGILDLLESFDIPQEILSINNPTIDYILSKFLIDSKIASLYPVSFMFQQHKDTNQFELWCKYLKNMGYTATSCISPTQVQIANQIFQIDQALVKKAQYIKDAFEKNVRNDTSGFVDDKYGFIDEPIYKNALNILRNAKEGKI